MIKAKTRQEIAKEFGVNRKTLYRWLKNENIQLNNRLISPDEQVVIYKLFGYPQSLLYKKMRMSHKLGQNAPFQNI